ncbi:MAG TPA: SOS response-associated peptidase family protein [Nitrososphaera sp.]|nr:SOS response-associated peptidase family protein [Nitrososphaera sp.]
MCGRSVFATNQVIENFYHVDRFGQLVEPNGVSRPGQRVPILFGLKGQTILTSAVWGWNPDVPEMYNARSETVAKRFLFKGAWADAQTCIFPLTSFFEQGQQFSGDQVLSVAGIYQTWWQDGKLYTICATMLTQPSIEPVSNVHPRMPAFVRDGNKWLHKPSLDDIHHEVLLHRLAVQAA